MNFAYKRKLLLLYHLTLDSNVKDILNLTISIIINKKEFYKNKSKLNTLFRIGYHKIVQ